MKTDVLIVGAGPAGLTMANVLARKGVSFRILDKKSGPVEESRALVVHAKILELLDKIGLAGRAVEQGQRMGAVELLKEGKSAGRISFLDDGADDRTPYPLVLILAQDLTERLLIQGLEEAGSRVEWNTEVLSLAQTRDGARVTVRDPDGYGNTIEAEWVVGADGAHGPVRNFLGLSLEGETYEQVLFLADVDLDWSLGAQQVHVDLTNYGFNGFFPMPGGERRFRLIGSLSPELASRDEVSLEDIRHLINDNSALDIDVTKARWTSVYRIHHRMTARFRLGRVFLIGDAAHIHSPAGGQGMNTGIGDAYNLGWKLAMVAKGEAKPDLLDSYEAERMPFARSILKGSDRGFALQVATNPTTQRLKLFTIPLLFRLGSTLPPVRRQLFWLLSQLWTSYRESPAVKQSGAMKKGPKAGERAPFGRFEAGANRGMTLFDLMKDTDHHLLLFEGGNTDPDRLEATRQEMERLLDRYEASIRIHPIPAENQELHKRYGAKAPSLFLIRPDGHIAYVGEASDIVSLRMYLDRLSKRDKERIEQNVSTQNEQGSMRA